MTTTPGEVWCVVVAAGSGTRFGSQKQFESLGADRVVDLSVRAAASACDGVVVVLPSEALEGGDVPVEADIAVAGGATRTASSSAGVEVVPADAEVIIVHDGARPMASEELFARVTAAVREGSPAVVPVVPVTDSIRTVDGSAVDRGELRAVQTPQAFRASTLREALLGAPEASDDAQAVESTGVSVRMVPGEVTNVKITTPADLLYVRSVLDGRSGEQ